MRNCGECTLCCTVTCVPEFNKSINVKCDHCKGSCAIYENRPVSCRTFKCAWLQGDLGDDMRPDKIHVVIEKLPNTPIVLALLEPGYNNVTLNNITSTMMTEYVDKGISVVCNGQALMAKDTTIENIIEKVTSAAKDMGVI